MTEDRGNTSSCASEPATKSKVVVDRTLHPLLSSPTTTTPSTTASSSNPIDASTERLHRLHGASLIQSSAHLLSLSPSTTATALTIFHRFYHRVPLAQVDVWSASMASVSVAGKVEEDLRRMSQIIAVFVHLYRRRRLAVGDGGSAVSRSAGGGNSNDNNNTHTPSISSSSSSGLTEGQKSNILRYNRPMPQTGPVYQTWSRALLDTETLILRHLGFTLYWIPDHHPHKFILYFLRVLKLDQGADGSANGANGENGGGKESGSVAQRSWNYCNDASLLDLSVRHEPEIVACAAILLATSSTGRSRSAGTQPTSISLPPMKPRPWWEVFVGPGREDDLMAVCNALLALAAAPGSDEDGENDRWEEQKRRAMRHYVPSLVVGGSFNDPGSYIWKALAD